MPSLVEIGPAVLEKNISKFHQLHIFAISLLSPLGKGSVLHLKIKFESLTPKDALFG